jgi:hypothetical protein
MKKKSFIAGIVLIMASYPGWSQDSATNKQPLKSESTLSSPIYPDSGLVNSSLKKGARSSVNPNNGTNIPGTTSGTLNSSVNPNTELVIPIRKKRKKLSPNAIPDSGITTPAKN